MTIDADFPLTLDDLLSVLAARGMLHHASLSSTTDGKWQASVKRPGSSHYHVRVKADPVDALRAALGPDVNQTWPELVGDDLSELFVDDDVEDIL